MDVGFDDLDDEGKKRLAFRKRLFNANGHINSPSSSQAQKVQVTKRIRMNGDERVDMDDNLRSATSVLEDRREQ
jgi:hypothetical protein